MKEILLSKGHTALVDDEDYERVNQFKWCPKVDGRTVYAQRNLYRNGKRTTQCLHIFILGENGRNEVDHRDGHGLNCQKGNLRRCSPQQNRKNKKRYLSNTSGFKGVQWHKAVKKYAAVIKHIHLGYFSDPADAAKAYNKAALQYFGDFANLNDVQEKSLCF